MIPTRELPTQSRLGAADELTRLRANEAYGKLPLSFELNQGQTDTQVKFLSRGSGYSLFLTSNEAVLSMLPNVDARDGGPHKASQRGTNDVLRLRLADLTAHQRSKDLKNCLARATTSSAVIQRIGTQMSPTFPVSITEMSIRV